METDEGKKKKHIEMAARSLLSLGLLLAPPGASAALFEAEETTAAPSRLFRLNFEDPDATHAFIDGTSSDAAVDDLLMGDADPGDGPSSPSGGTRGRGNVCGGRLDVQLSEGGDVLTFEPNELCSGDGYSGTLVPSRQGSNRALYQGTGSAFGDGAVHITLVPGPSSGTYAASIVDDDTGMVHTLMPDAQGEMTVYSLSQDDYDDEDDDLLLPEVEGMNEEDVVAMYMAEIDGEASQGGGGDSDGGGGKGGGCESLRRKKKCRRAPGCRWDRATSACSAADEPHAMKSHTVVGHSGGKNAYSLRHGAAHNIFGGDRRLEGTSTAGGSDGVQPRRRGLNEKPTHTLDVLVAYTTSAECQNANRPSNCSPNANTQDSMANRIDLAFKETNEAMALSGIDGGFRLVHAVRVDYNEAGKSFGDAISELRIKGDGEMDELHALRTQYGADMVSLLVGIPGSCGVAYVGPQKSAMFSIARYNCATGVSIFYMPYSRNPIALHAFSTS